MIQQNKILVSPFVRDRHFRKTQITITYVSKNFSKH